MITKIGIPLNFVNAQAVHCRGVGLHDLWRSLFQLKWFFDSVFNSFSVAGNQQLKDPFRGDRTLAIEVCKFANDKNKVSKDLKTEWDNLYRIHCPEYLSQGYKFFFSERLKILSSGDIHMLCFWVPALDSPLRNSFMQRAQGSCHLDWTSEVDYTYLQVSVN